MRSFAPEDENQDIAYERPSASVAAAQIRDIADMLERLPGTFWEPLRPTNGLTTDPYYAERPRAIYQLAKSIHALIFGEAS